MVRRRRRKMRTLLSTVLIAVLALGVLLALSPSRVDAWYGGTVVDFSLVVPPFGVSIGAPAPYYYPGPVYVAPPYPVYRRAYYSPYYGPYYGYGPYFRYRHWYHRGYGRGYGYWRY